MKVAAEKLRSLVTWLNCQNEGFNDRYKTPEDIVKVYEYCCNSNLVEYLDDIDWLEDEDYNTVKKDIENLLGYSLY